MPIVKTQGGKVVTKDGKVSCECCFTCEQNINAPHYRSVAITQQLYEMFRAGGTITVSSFEVSGSGNFRQTMLFLGQSWTGLVPSTNVEFSAQTAPLTGAHGIFPNTSGTCSIIAMPASFESQMFISRLCIPQATITSIGCRVAAGPFWVTGTDFLVPNLTFLDGVTPVRFRYMHFISDEKATIGGTYSNHWLHYSVALGVYCQANTSVLTDSSGVSGGLHQQARLMTRDAASFIGSNYSNTNENVTRTLSTPEGDISIVLTDCSKYYADGAFGLVGIPTMSWNSYPNFTWTPAAP